MEKKILVINRAIFALALFGVVIAAYLLYNYMMQSPIICIDTGCDTVRKSIYSSIFGMPVPLYGLIGFALIACTSLFYTILPKNGIQIVMLLFTTGGFVSVVWFTYVELFLIHALCMWCVISAAIMTSIFFLSLKTSLVIKKAYEINS